MNDFLIQFSFQGDGGRLTPMLRGRPGVGGHPVQTFEFPWGRVAVQPPVARGYAPSFDPASRTLVACVGRPRFVGVEHELRGPSGFNELARERLSNPRPLGDALTGMFALVECTPGGVRVLTDQMGFMPVYVGRDSAGRVAAVGTHLESVAQLAGRAEDFDPASLGDLLVNQYVTFPYTTRRGVTQVGPATLAEYDAGGRETATQFWQPCEPDPAGAAPGPEALEAELEAALRAAADDVVRGQSRVGLTLSGGLDSRLVLASLVGGKLAGAITYATRDNRELDVARRVARAAGVPHHVAWRGEEFYAELLPRAVGLLGTELRGECHGFCVVDNGLDRSFDVIVGGFLSDTLFKGHYLSRDARDRLRQRQSPLRRVRRAAASAARAVGLLPPPHTRPHYWDVARNMAGRLRPGVREEIAERHRVRLGQVRQVRPESAEEWLRFWPASRCDGAYGPQANTRLFTADELFMHRRLVELAARVPLAEKLDGRLTKRVFPRLYGHLGLIENAGTGLPASAEAEAEAEAKARRGKGDGDGHGPAADAAAGPPSRYPWNDVQHSWVDYELMQKLSPTWSSYRRALADSPALGVLDGVLEGGAREFVETYREEAGFLFNRVAVQLAYALDRTLRPGRPAAAAPRAANPPVPVSCT